MAEPAGRAPALGARRRGHHLDRALFMIAFNALGCIADPRFAPPVAPASVFFGACPLVGRQ
jgi:hypothetical protein